MSEGNARKIDSNLLLDMTARIVSAHAGNTTLSPAELTETIALVSRALAELSAANVGPDKKDLVPAVPVKKSVTADFIICLEDGKRLKMLKRHLMSTYGMTPEEYRTKWNLPRDYPMVAPNYAATRSTLAKKIGLGKSPRKSATSVSSKKSPARKG